MRFVWKLDCDSVKKVVCAFRSHADPGLQARLVQKLVQKSMFFSPCFYDDLGSIWGTLWGTILVKNREKCVAKTGFREVVKIVRKKKRF